MPNKPIYFYALFKTTAPDGSAFFGITRTQNPSYGQDGTPVNYMGNGPKLIAKARQYGGLSKFTHEVLSIESSYETQVQRLDRILNPATLADPRCLNMPRPDKLPKVSEALSGKSKSEFHKMAISEGLIGNENFAGHVHSEETKEKIAESVSKARANLKYYHNPKTGEEITLEPDEDVLTGFVAGKLPKELKGKLDKAKKYEIPDALKGKLSNND
jgi:hypothetical protein